MQISSTSQLASTIQSTDTNHKEQIGNTKQDAVKTDTSDTVTLSSEAKALVQTQGSGWGKEPQKMTAMGSGWGQEPGQSTLEE